MIENIVRAIILKNDSVLVVRRKGCTNTFLPGGHVEMLEGLEQALNREIKEETGLSGICKEFICCIENIYSDNGSKAHEIGYYFNYEINDIPDNIVSKEDHLEFFWCDLVDIDSNNLLPLPARNAVKQLNKGKISLIRIFSNLNEKS